MKNKLIEKFKENLLKNNVKKRNKPEWLASWNKTKILY